jgi:hypothetical protein
MKIDPNIRVWTPQYILDLAEDGPRFWLTVLWLKEQKGYSMKRAYTELEQLYAEYFGKFKYADIRNAERSYKIFIAKARKSGKMIIKTDFK